MQVLMLGSDPMPVYTIIFLIGERCTFMLYLSCVDSVREKTSGLALWCNELNLLTYEEYIRQLRVLYLL